MPYTKSEVQKHASEHTNNLAKRGEKSRNCEIHKINEYTSSYQSITNIANINTVNGSSRQLTSAPSRSELTHSQKTLADVAKFVDAARRALRVYGNDASDRLRDYARDAFNVYSTRDDARTDTPTG